MEATGSMIRILVVTASFRVMDANGPLHMDTTTGPGLARTATAKVGREAMAVVLDHGAMVIRQAAEAAAIHRQAGATLHRAAVQTAGTAAILRPFRSLLCPSRQYRAPQSPT